MTNREEVDAAIKTAWKDISLWESNKAGPGVGEKKVNAALTRLILLGVRLGLEAAEQTCRNAEVILFAQSMGRNVASNTAIDLGNAIREVHHTSVLEAKP